MSQLEVQPLCALDDLPDPGSRGFEVELAGRPERIFVVRQGGAVHGYINRCPHAGSPLDWMPDRFLSLDKTEIQCATHDARFRIRDGVCTAGPCVGERLTPIGVRVEHGRIVLDPAAVG